LGVEDKSRLVEQLAASQRQRLLKYLRRRVRNAADIPDIIQEVFLRFLRVPHHETIRTPEAYIFTIARHVAQQHRLAAAPSADSVDLEKVIEDLCSVADGDPVLHVTAEQCVEQLEEALSDMPAKMQATFLMYRRDNLPLDQICERLGISRPMAKKYLAKAFVQFRKRLKEAE
jgi:RNA polymerase sigma factor (sigma-70 family)